MFARADVAGALYMLSKVQSASVVFMPLQPRSRQHHLRHCHLLSSHRGSKHNLLYYCRTMQMPSEASWTAMATLHHEIGLRFIIGLPLNNNNEQLMAAMVRKARQVLPAAAIAGFELGNEPMYWEVCPDVKIGAVSVSILKRIRAFAALEYACQQLCCSL
jgi:hypothetical protein